jgi:hypothetical protein
LNFNNAFNQKSIIQEFFDFLSSYNHSKCLKISPGLMRSVSMISIFKILSISWTNFYIIKKVTNQMINTICRVNNQGEFLHEQDRRQLIWKFNESFLLNEKHQSLFHTPFNERFLVAKKHKRSVIKEFWIFILIFIESLMLSQNDRGFWNDYFLRLTIFQNFALFLFTLPLLRVKFNGPNFEFLIEKKLHL